MSQQSTSRLTKRRIGLIQLCRSVDLLTNHDDPVSALTLAGAAEELFGKIAAKRGHYTSLEDNGEWLRGLAKWAGVSAPSLKEACTALNTVRNALKHNDRGTEKERLQADFEFEAQEMIMRAMHNHFKAFGCLPASKSLKSFYWNQCL